MELTQEVDFSVTLPREAFAKKMKLRPTSPASWAGRMNPPVGGRRQIALVRIG